MTTFTTTPDADIDQDSPITVTLMTAYRDNLLAVLELDSSAPKMAVSYTRGASSGGAWFTIDDFDDFQGCRVSVTWVGDAGGGTHKIEVQWSDDNQTSWSSSTTIMDETGAYDVTDMGFIEFDGGGVTMTGEGTATLSGSPTDDITDLRIRASGGVARILVERIGPRRPE
jgi:hypothetical protein